MSHWNFGGTKPIRTILIVVCAAANDYDGELVSIASAIPARASGDSEPDETPADTVQDGYVYIDVEKCAQA